MSEEALRLQVGERLQLQRIAEEANDRYSVKVIGYLPGQSLLVTNPVLDGKALFFREGQRFAVRMLDGSRVWGFVSQVQYAASKPFPYLHLSYPDDVESMAVRNAERVETRIHGLARNSLDPDEQVNWHPLIIRDISRSGARLESVSRLGREGETIELRFGMEVCGREDHLSLAALVRKSDLEERSDARGVRHISGVEFAMINRFQELLLNGYILEQRVSE